MDEANHEKATDSQGITVNSLESLSFKSVMENSGQSWGIKDKESRFVYMNKVSLDAHNLPIGFDIEGRLDEECPAPWAQFATEFRKHDRETEKNRKNVAIISTQLWGREQKLEPYYIEKTPLYNGLNECIGTIFNARKLNFYSFSQYVGKLTPSVLILTPPISRFTERELDVVFYLQQSLPAKVIARKLNVSHNTVGKYKDKIFQKAGVYSVDQFKEFCRETGLDRYIPKKFIQPGVQFV
ncbi:LuxR C-terminal-related transcriptional regulator [Candidatus Fukatsuia symbiotica]|uniref:helix-turn-helix transcriptional regulator n=1 Tax=Candidatus Fukatsuia TaxID=1927833 RepID=UPI000E725131|nr:LuxR C-terminal-related transcriptional regulator [Candidatus Fukatsuia symbiotica]MEA9444819.1 LuxR C-terminal-related transcriptional regulator [Candidatus Fukatsuia symbiotica]